MSGEPKRLDDEEVRELLDCLDEEPSGYSKRKLEASVVPISKPVKRGPGRPRKVYGPLPPTVSREEYNMAVLTQQAKFVESDELVKAVARGGSSDDTLRLLRERIARSAAVLEFTRLDQQKRGLHGKDVCQLINRQISALKDVANIELAIHKSGTAFDLKNPKLQQVFKILIDTFRDVAKEVLPAAQFDLVWNRLETELEGWEEKADSLTR